MKQIGPKISIITACFNSEKTIEQTIQSVLHQSYGNIEYIIIDGNSTDRTMEIVNKYRNGIDIVVSEEDEGIYDAFNKGVKLATGDYINFMNSDDFFSSAFIVEEVARHLKTTFNVKMLHGNVRAFDEKSGHWHLRGELLTLADFEMGKMCPHQSVFTHKDLFAEFSYFDLKYQILSDVDFTIKCFKKYEDKIVYIPLEIAKFRLGGLSTSISYDKKLHEENASIHFQHFSSVPEYTNKRLQDYELYYANEQYRVWLEHILLNRDILSETLKGISGHVAIFGTKKNATLLYHFLKNNGMKVSCFIDNDKQMQNEQLHAKPIVSPLEVNMFNVGKVIISIERFHVAEEIKHSLQSQFPDIQVYTWYDLIS